MSTLETIKELETRKRDLLRSLSLYEPAPSEDLPESLKDIDPDFARRLVTGLGFEAGGTGFSPDTTMWVIETVRSTPEGQEACLRSDIELLEHMQSQKCDRVHRSPFGTVEGLFPVIVRNHLVHCIWTGKIAGPDCSDGPSALTEDQVNEVMKVYAALRDRIKEALKQNLKVRSISDQLLKSERTRSLGTLSAGVAHHFNNLLSVILGYSSFVSNREELSEEATNSLRQISDAAQRGRRLTEEILAFTGEREDPTPCNVHETLTNVLSLLQSQTASTVKIESQLSASSDAVIAPPGEIRQMIFNLLTNAIDSMPTGGLLTVRSSNTDVSTEEGKEAYLRVEVVDSSGIMPTGFGTTLAADQTHAEDDRMSMKLSSVYGMVGRMAGTLMISSEPGEQTRVEVLLPLAGAAGTPGVEPAVRKRLAPSHIWVVDDDPIFREMCKQVLGDDGHDVEQIASGVDMQERWGAGGKKPDLLVIDFSMPEYNGLELREWLKEQGSRAPVILVSGFAPNQPDIKKALKIRNTFFLQKPFSVPELADIVTVALGETLIGE